MMRYAALLSALLLWIPNPALGEWTEIGSSRGPEEFILYADPLKLPDEHRIVVSFPHLKQFTQARVHPGTGRLIRSVIVDADYDCHLERERIVATTAYEGGMGRGAVVATEPGDGQWTAIARGDLRMLLWQAACR
ncbi:MAG: hypothetical protein RL768_2954 [Nitrospirota bacterium]|jgi:hypothetical protein